jgi:hypothetical protein
LEKKVNEMESHAQQLRQEVDNRSEAIKMVKQEVCMKSADEEWMITLPDNCATVPMDLKHTGYLHII